MPGVLSRLKRATTPIDTDERAERADSPASATLVYPATILPVPIPSIATPAASSHFIEDLEPNTANLTAQAKASPVPLTPKLVLTESGTSTPRSFDGSPQPRYMSVCRQNRSVAALTSDAAAHSASRTEQRLHQDSACRRSRVIVARRASGTPKDDRQSCT